MGAKQGNISSKIKSTAVLQLKQCNCTFKHLCHLGAYHIIIKYGCPKGCTGQCQCFKTNTDVGVGGMDEHLANLQHGLFVFDI